jgi:hypothetical protein
VSTIDVASRVGLDDDQLATVTESLVSLLAAAGATGARSGDASTMGPRDWTRVVATETFDAWLIRWPTGGAVDMHDHGGSAGMIAVLDGELVELRPGEHDGPVERRLPTGSRHRVHANAIHDVVNPGERAAISLHVYSPPLETMGFYDGSGRLDRVEVVGFEAPRWPTVGWWDE